ncbi:MAG: glutathione transport system substrate-binding protein, partial [Mycobacterium sp.]|nr:glutathione transport system substrate-binding protein [Mycobacterium sp.]
MEIRRLVSALLVAGLTLSACSGGHQEAPSAGGNAEVGTSSDMNPQDPAKLQDGGDLRLALTNFPDNFNTLHINGPTADAAAISRATMPRAFRIAADGTTTVNTDFFTSV